MSPNQISHKSVKVDPIVSSRTWKKSEQILNFYALQHIKLIFTKTIIKSWSQNLNIVKWEVYL